jgi:hypothetical protein
MSVSAAAEKKNRLKKKSAQEDRWQAASKRPPHNRAAAKVQRLTAHPHQPGATAHQSQVRSPLKKKVHYGTEFYF